MKKIYQLGFLATLIALLPTGILLAGNGNNTISINPASSRSIILMVNTTGTINMDDIAVSTETPGVSINSIVPVINGFEVAIDLDPTIFNPSSVGVGGGAIVIEIVGVDNITGVDASDGSTGTGVSTNMVAHFNDPLNYSDGNAQNNGTGMQSNPNDGNGIHVVPSFGNAKDDIKIYPNPVIDQTNVVTVGEILGRTIQIIDLTGHVVANYIVPSNSRQMSLDLSALNPGIYILNYETEDGRIISKKIQKV